MFRKIKNWFQRQTDLEKRIIALEENVYSEDRIAKCRANEKEIEDKRKIIYVNQISGRAW